MAEATPTDTVTRADFLAHAPAVERQLAALLERHAPAAGPELAATLTLLGLLRERGDLCVELDRWAGQALPVDEPEKAPRVPTRARIEAALRELPFVGDGTEPQPLVLRQGRVHLWRFFAGERELASRLALLAQAPPFALAPDALRTMLGPVEAAGSGIDWQSVAVHAALRHRLCVITGGPGTGKTTVVLRVLAALLTQDEGLDVALAAPTGKAAARMLESVRDRADALPAPLRARLPEQVVTLHRLLGLPLFGGAPRHGPAQPLPQRLVVVDEVSMVDLETMLALVRALRRDARLILLGDADQLASVGAGAVLRELCLATDPAQGHGEAFAREHEVATGQTLPVATTRGPLGDASVRLRQSHRFGAASGIGRLADAVREGDAGAALALLRDPKVADVELVEAEADGASARLAALLAPRFAAATPEAALEEFAALQVLCALRRGPFGVSGVSGRLEEGLRSLGVSGAGHLAKGRPVLVTRNDPSNGLSNGDVGVAWPEGGQDFVYFPAAERPRRLPAARLPAHDDSLAMTIHKSQGSEYDHVWIVLPATEHPILCAELLYTAITRARARVTLQTSERALRFAIGRRTARASTLADALREHCGS